MYGSRLMSNAVLTTFPFRDSFKTSFGRLYPNWTERIRMYDPLSSKLVDGSKLFPREVFNEGSTIEVKFKLEANQVYRTASNCAIYP